MSVARINLEGGSKQHGYALQKPENLYEMTTLLNVLKMRYFLVNRFRIFSIVLLLAMILPPGINAEDYELYIAMGIQRLSEGKTEDAIALLEKALQIAPENTEASYYAAIAYSRAGRYKEAEALFSEAMQADGNAVTPYLELGNVYYMTSRCDKAEEFLSRFINLSDNPDLQKYAAGLIETCGKAREGRPFRLSVTTGYQYDNNVILEPSNPTDSEEDKKADSRALVYITSGASLWEKGAVKLKVDYNFYQSLHSQLDDYDLHYHKIRPLMEIYLSDMFRPSAGYSLEYIVLGGDRYSRVSTYFGKFATQLNRELSVEAVYEYKDEKYLYSDSFQTNPSRTGFQNTMGIRQIYNLGNLSGEIYSIGDFKRAEKKYWAFNGYRTGAEVDYEIISPLSVIISGEVNIRHYRDDFPGFQKKRFDKMHQFSLMLTYMISERVAVSITDTHIVNDSNLQNYDYKRNIMGIFLTGGLL